MNRVCMVVHKAYHGDPRVRRYTESLLAAGARVDVVCLQPRSQRERPVATPGLRVLAVPVRHGSSARGGYLAEYAAALTHFTARLLPLQLRERYDVIHVHNMPD
ncbi:MAG: glycosyltransferase, partial [Candidatus Latescibacterota bacterium]